ncbi:YpbF family protein [Cytobacillus sp. Hm23]
MIEEKIKQLHTNTDQVTKQLLQHLVDRKRKFEFMKQRVKVLQYTLLFLCIIFFLYILFFIVQPFYYSTSKIMSIFLGDEIHLFVLLTIFSVYGTILYYKKKVDKTEKEFHDLRCEVIRKSIELWPQPIKWHERERVFDLMQTEYDINLYHESK